MYMKQQNALSFTKVTCSCKYPIIMYILCLCKNLLSFLAPCFQVFSAEGKASHEEKNPGQINNQCLGDPTISPIEDGFLLVLNWVVGVWMNMNKCLIKLGYPLLVEGPCAYFECPANPYKPYLTFR